MRSANSHRREAPASTRIGKAPTAATSVRRAVSERAGASALRSACGDTSDSDWVIADQVAEAAPRLDEIGAEFLAQAIHQYLDDVGILVEVLVVDVLRQLGLGDDGIRPMHQVGEQ